MAENVKPWARKIENVTPENCLSNDKNGFIFRMWAPTPLSSPQPSSTNAYWSFFHVYAHYMLLLYIFLVPFSTAHFGWHQIRAHILWPKYGWIKEQILERIKLVELDEIENNICWNFTLRFAMSNNLFRAKVFIFFGKGRMKGKWRWVKLDHKWYCIKTLWKLTGLWTCQEVCLFWEKLLPEL